MPRTVCCMWRMNASRLRDSASGSAAAGRAPALGRAAHALARHLRPRPRVVALLDRAGVRAQERLEALEIELGRPQLRLRGARLGFRRLDLCLRLPHVFFAGARLQQPQLRIGGLALGACARELQLCIRRIEPGDEVALRDAVPFGDAQLQQAPADLRGHLHLRRFDVARHASGALVVADAARRHGDGAGQHE